MPSHLTLLSPLRPPCSTRTWLSAPHPTLPLLATASSDRTVRVYSLTSFTLLSTISGGHKRSIRTCAWKPGTKGESVLATGSFDASAGIWRKWERGSSGLVRDPDDIDGGGDYDGGEDEEDEYNFSVLLDGHDSEIKSVAWSSGGQYLATCSRDKTVWIWEELEDDNFETIAVLNEHEGDVKFVCWHPSEDLLASSSYDDTVRLYKEDLDDWTAVACLSGHEGTVWCVDFEGDKPRVGLKDGKELSEEQKKFIEERERSGPRLASSSDDMTIRIWRRRTREGQNGTSSHDRIPSILKSNSIEEDWYEEAQLPKTHDRAIYAVSWSKKSGLIVSTGSDGKILVYQERWKSPKETTESHSPGAESMDVDKLSISTATEWVIIAEVEGAHDVFEVNHVNWARRYDRGRRNDEEEVIITTGDDGEVKVWTLDHD
ncbi:WD40 repeat-like protein [Patellaria atrata CBS 101060]|uniref:Probable cytosolic iron-sulfur protein assembly protein 1 n=1 Tax=Patellaria atrata CBS 101060 TaxID=1346257 RepID=A0A9P4VSV1_9PEZI|nr:WD40 repeat-like protein [Patellaria atrata CBS 101060]